MCLIGVAFGDQVTKQLESKYASISSAFKRQDIKAISDLMAPDYVIHLENGMTMNKAKVIADYKTQMRMISTPNWGRKILKTEHKGGAVVATVEGRFTGTVVGPDSKRHQFALFAVAADAWKKTGSGWQLLSTSVSKRQATMDGRIMRIPPATK
jgi:ketosteroid isomerase-like protein